MASLDKEKQILPAEPTTAVDRSRLEADEGPGAGLRNAGAILLMLSFPATFILYIGTLSPSAPARYYSRIAGIDDATSQIALVVGSFIASMVIIGLLLYWVGAVKRKRAER